MDSAILRIEIYAKPLIPNEFLKTFFKLIKAGLHIKTTEAEALLTSAGIDFMRRAETLSIDEWKGLCEKKQRPVYVNIARNSERLYI